MAELAIIDKQFAFFYFDLSYGR